MKNSKIVILNWRDSTHPEAGGAEVYCSNLAQELALLGAQVTYLTARSPGTAKSERVDGYTVKRMGGTYGVYPRVLLWILGHRRHIDGIVDSQNGIPFFSPLVAGRRKPVVLLIHHVHQQQFSSYFSPFMAKVGRWLEGTATRVVYGARPVCTVSPSSRREVRSQLELKGPIFLVPNGNRRTASLPAMRASVPTITCVGRLVPHKRWELLIAAGQELVRRIPEIRINIVGAGSESAALTELVERSGMTANVVLHGFVAADERDRLLEQAWLTVSTSAGEGWGLSIIEAAAKGVPAVALDVAGLRDSVCDEVTGWLATEATLVSTLSTALDQLRSNTVAADMARACQAWADSLLWSSTADRIEAVLQGERERLRHAAERRHARSDVSTIVTLDQTAAGRIRLERLRVTDQATFCPSCVDDVNGVWRILLNGADESGALIALDRLGLQTNGPGVQVTLCRPRELLGWQGDAKVHGARVLTKISSCPNAPHPTLMTAGTPA
jgi:glycosyltransferase involved in cell wall biosynthesis